MSLSNLNRRLNGFASQSKIQRERINRLEKNVYGIMVVIAVFFLTLLIGAAWING